MYACTHVQVPSEARRGHWISWARIMGSCELPIVAAWNWGTELGFSARAASVLKHLTIFAASRAGGLRCIRVHITHSRKWVLEHNQSLKSVIWLLQVHYQIRMSTVIWRCCKMRLHSVSVPWWRARFIYSIHNSSAQLTEVLNTYDIPALRCHTRCQRDLSKHWVMLFFSIKLIFSCFLKTVPHSLPTAKPICPTCNSLSNERRAEPSWTTLMSLLKEPRKSLHPVTTWGHMRKTPVHEPGCNSSLEPWSVSALTLNFPTSQLSNKPELFMWHLTYSSSERPEFFGLLCIGQSCLCWLYNCADYGHY